MQMTNCRQWPRALQSLGRGSSEQSGLKWPGLTGADQGPGRVSASPTPPQSAGISSNQSSEFQEGTRYARSSRLRCNKTSIHWCNSEVPRLA